MALYAIETENEECLAEGGGRHWDLTGISGDWQEAKRGDALIDSSTGLFMGIAEGDYNDDLDEIVVCRAGGWNIEVVGHDTGGSNCAIAQGETIYYDVSDGEFNRDYANGIAVGFAMGAVGSGATKVIGVQLQPRAPLAETAGA